MNLNQQPPERAVKASDTIDLHSMFSTIQGEGPHAGRRAIFIRLAGCNLQCPMCDTEYTRGRQGLPLHVIMELVRDLTYPIPELVVITGGEPLRQPIAPLAHALLDAGFRVQVETNGTLYRELPFDHPRFSIVCSPKMHTVHPHLVPHICAFKYVARAEDLAADGLPNSALEHPTKHGLFRPPPEWEGEIYLQPVDEQDEQRNILNLKAVVRACIQHGHRLCLQLHKIIGLE